MANIMNMFPGGGAAEVMKAATSVNKPDGSSRYTYVITGLGFSTTAFAVKWGTFMCTLIWNGVGDKNLVSSWDLIFSTSASTIHSISVGDDGLSLDATFYNVGSAARAVDFTLQGVA